MRRRRVIGTEVGAKRGRRSRAKGGDSWGFLFQAIGPILLLSACAGDSVTVDELVEAGVSESRAEEIVANEVNDSGVTSAMSEEELLAQWSSASPPTSAVQPDRSSCEELLERSPSEVVTMRQATCRFSFGGPATGLTGGSECALLRTWENSPYSYESISLRMDGVLAVWVARPDDTEWSFQSWDGSEVDAWPDAGDFWRNTLEPACGEREELDR